ncbi:MAG: hypothetical protein HY924_09940 [Elusimicrobia bacterium]|nr:hypothetical protein [Elusimicrobiota bacterium]
MRNVLITIGIVAMTAVALAVTPAKQGKTAVEGGDVKVTGKLTCTYCRLAHPGKDCKKGCCSGCIKSGDPAILTDDEGNMYVLLNKEIKRPLMDAQKLALAGSRVEVTGTMAKGQGVQAIFVENMKKTE